MCINVNDGSADRYKKKKILSHPLSTQKITTTHLRPANEPCCSKNLCNKARAAIVVSFKVLESENLSIYYRHTCQSISEDYRGVSED